MMSEVLLHFQKVKKVSVTGQKDTEGSQETSSVSDEPLLSSRTMDKGVLASKTYKRLLPCVE